MLGRTSRLNYSVFTTKACEERKAFETRAFLRFAWCLNAKDARLISIRYDCTYDVFSWCIYQLHLLQSRKTTLNYGGTIQYICAHRKQQIW